MLPLHLVVFKGGTPSLLGKEGTAKRQREHMGFVENKRGDATFFQDKEAFTKCVCSELNILLIMQRW
jgi:hypothetical protein